MSKQNFLYTKYKKIIQDLIRILHQPSLKLVPSVMQNQTGSLYSNSPKAQEPVVAPIIISLAYLFFTIVRKRGPSGSSDWANNKLLQLSNNNNINKNI